MIIKYSFVTGNEVFIEVDGELGDIILELKGAEKKNNRTETRRHESLNNFDKDQKSADLKTDIYGQVLKNLDKNKLYEAIAKLKPKENELLYALYLRKNPISQVELAKIQNVSVGSIKMKLQRIKAKLKNCFKP